MHRKHRALNWLAAGCLSLGLAAPGAAYAQPEPLPMPGTGPAANGNRAAARSNALVVAINGTKRLSMSPKRPIRSVVNEKENVARVQAIVDDPTAVLVVGLQAGSTHVTMTDTAGQQEVVEVVVEFDIDVVRAVLKRAFPTANVEPVPAGTNTIVLVGNVNHAEEIEAILRVAQGVLVSGVPAGAQGTGTGGTTTIVNALTVGGVRQVQLDVTLASVNRSELRNLGVNFTVAGTQVFAGSLIGNLATPGQNAGGGGTAGFLSSLTPGPSTNIVAGIVPANLTTFIQALRQERLAKVLTEPRLVAHSGRPATLLSGGQQAVPEVTASGVGGGTVGARFEPFGTTLTFLPIVLGNGRIYLEVESAVSNLNQANGFAIGGVVVPGRDEQRVRTSVTMEPGQTFAIGGLIQTLIGGVTNKTPVLGDLPFVGPVFSTVSYSEQETELVILITPYLVDPMDCKQAPCKLPGLETRSPDDFELFLELILEAPRGQREVFPGQRYRPAYLNDSTAGQFPCGGAGGSCGANGGGGCASGSCGQPAGVVPAAATDPLRGYPAADPAVLPAVAAPRPQAARAAGRP